MNISASAKGAICSRPCSSIPPAARTAWIAHQLPAARGYGEPLSGTVDPPDGATFAAVLIGEPMIYGCWRAMRAMASPYACAKSNARNKKGNRC